MKEFLNSFSKKTIILIVSILFILCYFVIPYLLQNQEDILLIEYKNQILEIDKKTQRNDSENAKNATLKECIISQMDRILKNLPTTPNFCEIQEKNTSFVPSLIPQVSADYEQQKKKSNKQIIRDTLHSECVSQKVKNVTHCVNVGLSIAYAESTWRDTKTPFGLQGKDKSYKKWVFSYKKFWYKAKDGSFFYGKNGKAGKSHYCLFEESSGTEGRCPNGRLSFDKIFNSLKK